MLAELGPPSIAAGATTQRHCTTWHMFALGSHSERCGIEVGGLGSLKVNVDGLRTVILVPWASVVATDKDYKGKASAGQFVVVGGAADAAGCWLCHSA